MQQSLFIDPNRPIEQVNGNRLRQFDRLFSSVRPAYGIAYFFGRPIRVFSEQIFSQFERFFNSDTSGAEIPPAPGKELLGRCVVQIDFIRVRKSKIFGRVLMKRFGKYTIAGNQPV